MSRQYMSAAKAVDAVDSGRQSFKSYCGSSGKIGKVDFALAAETMKYSSVLEIIFEKAGISAKKLDVGSGMLKVMSYELLFGKEKISGGGAVKRAIMEVKDKMSDALDDVMKARGVSEHKGLLSAEVVEAAKMPKYIRINEIKLPDVEVGLLEIKKACPSAVYDDMIPSLVVLPPGKSLGEHPFVKDGRLIIQDKASCFPSQCLYDVWSERKVGDIIDACAAPGNKTSHVAALVDRHLKEGIKCKIFAFDKNPQRAQLLKNRMQAAGAQHIVQVSNEDFLSVDVHSSKYKDVTCILLDPSCSGSGVARVLERVIERQSGSEANIPVDARLDKLRAFQIAALRKAMSFPAVEYVVYSTCSIHIEENESVVSEVLTATSEELPIDSTGPPSSPSSWSVAEPKRLLKWTRRGLPFEGLPLEMQQRLIRCQPSDGLNGFFVAVMQKCVSHDTVPTQGMEQAGVTEVVMDTVIEMPHTGPSEGTSTAVDSFRDVIRRIKPDENYPEAPFFASMAASLPSKTFNSMYRPVGKFRRLKRVSKRHSTLWRPLSFSVHF